MTPVSSPLLPFPDAATLHGPVVVVGAGGFGREVLDIVDAMNHVGATLELLGTLDDSDANADTPCPTRRETPRRHRRLHRGSDP